MILTPRMDYSVCIVIYVNKNKYFNNKKVLNFFSIVYLPLAENFTSQHFLNIPRLPMQTVYFSADLRLDFSHLKGAVSLFYVIFLFHESKPSGPLRNRLKCFFLKIRFHEDIHEISGSVQC